MIHIYIPARHIYRYLDIAVATYQLVKKYWVLFSGIGRLDSFNIYIMWRTTTIYLLYVLWLFNDKTIKVWGDILLIWHSLLRGGTVFLQNWWSYRYLKYMFFDLPKTALAQWERLVAVSLAHSSKSTFNFSKNAPFSSVICNCFLKKCIN